MKRIIPLLFLVFISCSKDTDSLDSPNLFGKWELYSFVNIESGVDYFLEPGENSGGLEFKQPNLYTAFDSDGIDNAGTFTFNGQTLTLTHIDFEDNIHSVSFTPVVIKENILELGFNFNKEFGSNSVMYYYKRIN